MKWISVEERLPDKLQKAMFKIVINDFEHFVYGEKTKNGNQLRFVSHWDLADEGHFLPAYSICHFSFVNHWKPSPNRQR